ncbi:uncharacterized protein GIQ15_05730 [Arthroderma uncinatum]|uniref:uncharacterized protein n=1 Tax=Arthroderma uncinatum TaxID=74035 RepID=UPI00144A5696|nr:uncharacterized protein GIQ15_05730 [Arthroderma uncinatum]KAF3480383.1 hypothetical protein GIQ15_05730 [Arthroderma uncinatum]
MRATTSILFALCAAGTAMAHMEMQWPYALRSKFNKQNTNPDWSMTGPLNPSGADFPCKGYHKAPFQSVASYEAGGEYNLTLAGNTRHQGGSCQVSLSYDNGKTFKVINSYLGGCPMKDTYNFNIPTSAPDGQALLAWSWFNLVGNREMYMNCAHVTVNGGSDSKTKFNALPDMFVANVGNGCSTIEGKEIVFKNPGEKVQYGDGVTAQTEISPKCGSNAKRSENCGGIRSAKFRA